MLMSLLTRHRGRGPAQIRSVMVGSVEVKTSSGTCQYLVARARQEGLTLTLRHVGLSPE